MAWFAPAAGPTAGPESRNAFPLPTESFCREKDDSPVGRMKFALWAHRAKGGLQDVQTKLLFLLSSHRIKFVFNPFSATPGM